MIDASLVISIVCGARLLAIDVERNGVHVDTKALVFPTAVGCQNAKYGEFAQRVTKETPTVLTGQ
jgi:hypothetical protein